MKTKVNHWNNTVLAALFALFVCSACDSEGGEIWDIAPITLDIQVKDAQGNDLLDSTRTDNLISRISVSYGNETYPVQTEQSLYQARTRAYLAHFDGLILRRSWNYQTYTAGNYKLTFGEFSGEENVKKREVVVDFGDGHTFKLAYDNSFKWKSNGDPKINRKYYLNGEQLEDSNGNGGLFVFQYTASGDLRYVPAGK